MPYWMYASETAALRRSWIPLLAWGVAFMALGVVIMGVPEVLGTFLLVALGISSVLAGLGWAAWVLVLRHDSGGAWVAAVVPGALLAAFGAYTLLYPARVGGFFTVVAGIALAAWGFADMVSSMRLHRYFPGWWVRLLRGIIVCATGILVALQRPAGLAAFSIALGIVPLLVGGMTVWMALWIRRMPASGPVVVTSAGMEAPARDEGREALPPAE